MITLWTKQGIGELVLLSLGLLQANDVSLCRRQPLEEALAGRGSDSIAVKSDDSHNLLSAETCQAARVSLAQNLRGILRCAPEQH